MKYLRYSLLILLLWLLQYLSQNLFVLKYVHWIVVYATSLYWFRNKSMPFSVVLISGLIVDISVQGIFGITPLSIFLPMLIFTLVDSALRIENYPARLIYCEVSCIISISLIQLTSTGVLNYSDLTTRFRYIILEILGSGLVIFFISILLYYSSLRERGFKIR